VTFFHQPTIIHTSPEAETKFYMNFVKTDYPLLQEDDYYIKY